MPLRPRTPERYSFANIDEVLPLPDLIAVQRDSFEWFLDRGLAETFGDISPIADFTDQLSLKLDFDPDRPGPTATAQVLDRRVQGEGHHLRRSDLRPGVVHEPLDR